MSWSHIRSFYPFTFIIKKTTAILKKYIFANILSYARKLKKNIVKKVYIIINNSKSNRDFNSIFFTMMRKTVCDDIFQGYKNPEKKSNLIYTTSRHIVRWSFSWWSWLQSNATTTHANATVHATTDVHVAATVHGSWIFSQYCCKYLELSVHSNFSVYPLPFNLSFGFD